MTVLVTGAAGFVGSHLVEELLRRGQPVRAMVRKQEQAAALSQRGVEVIMGDVRNLDDAKQAVKGVDVVYHCAAVVGHQLAKRVLYETNLGGVRTMLDAIKDAAASRLVMLSSINVLGIRNFDAGSEELPTRRVEPHADVKIDAEKMAETYCRDHNVDLVVLRPGLIYGPGDKNIPKILDAVRRGKFSFIGSRDHVVPIVYVSDLVAAMIAAGETPDARGRTYHITDGSRTTIGELVDAVAEHAGCEKPQKVIPKFIPKAVANVFGTLNKLRLRKKPGPITKVGLRFLATSRHVDISRAQKELGYAPQVGYEDGITRHLDSLEAETNKPADVAAASA